MSPFLWPRGRFTAGALAGLAGAKAGTVEVRLQAMFPAAHPVLTSSGRASLSMLLTVMGLRRPDRVRVPPYASHCVLEAIARVATPSPWDAVEETTGDVVYHQWGHLQSGRRKTETAIEDACDTLCAPGARLMPLGGRFEFWSLPKILGCVGGGVIWCRDEADAQSLRRERDGRNRGGALQWWTRVLGRDRPALHRYWAGSESAGGQLPRIGIADVALALERWDEQVALRRRNLGIARALCPAWLPLAEDRLPSVVPIAPGPGIEQTLRAAGLGIGLRHFERIHGDGRIELVPVHPLPIHQDVDPQALAQVIKALGT